MEPPTHPTLIRAVDLTQETLTLERFKSEIVEAYQGELWGEGYFDHLIQCCPSWPSQPSNLVQSRQRKLSILSAQEAAVAKLMEPVLEYYGAQRTLKREDLRTQGRNRAAEVPGWRALLEQLAEDLPPYIELYRLLAWFANDASIRTRMDILQDHEVALWEFVQHELSDLDAETGDKGLERTYRVLAACEKLDGSEQWKGRL